jgi:hypothetical protein
MNNYRYLNVDEIIQEGDEIYIGLNAGGFCHWEEVEKCLIGLSVVVYPTLRRPIKD